MYSQISQAMLLFYTTDAYFEKAFVMITCFFELFRLLLMAVQIPVEQGSTNF